tara:strand:+ start:749 stop:1261 length:513 start_codon:yes stop_codon:yes gene_type:complete
MTPIDAAKILGLSNDISPESVKLARNTAALKNHPDIVGDSSILIMQMINEAYETLKGFSGNLEYDQGDNFCEVVSAAIQAIIGFDRLSVEICGSWVWVSGTTSEGTTEMIDIRSALKLAGFKYSRGKNKWYTMPKSESKRFRNKKTKSMDQIRNTYGSRSVDNKRSKLAS